MNLHILKEINYYNNGYFHLLFHDKRNLTLNKDLAEALGVVERELRSFMQANGCIQTAKNDFVIHDDQNVEELLSNMIQHFSK